MTLAPKAMNFLLHHLLMRRGSPVPRYTASGQGTRWVSFLFILWTLLLVPSVSAADNLNLLDRAIGAWRFSEAREVLGKLRSDERATPKGAYLTGRLLFYEGDCKGALDELRRANRGRTAELAARHAKRCGWPEGLAHEYLNGNLRYELGGRELAAIEEFWRRCRDLGIIERLRPLKLYGRAWVGSGVRRLGSEEVRELGS